MDPLKEHQDSLQAPATKNPEPASHHRLSFTPTTLISFVLYGGLGALVGHKLGEWGSGGERKLAQRMLTWGLGILTGFLAAYSSSKTEQRTDERLTPADIKPQVPAAPPMPTLEPVTIAPPAPSKPHAPQPSIAAEYAMHEGALSDSPQYELA